MEKKKKTDRRTSVGKRALGIVPLSLAEGIMEKHERFCCYLFLFSLMIGGLLVKELSANGWGRVAGSGFGDVDNKSLFPMKIFNDALYVGGWNDAGAEIWMTSQATTGIWQQVNSNGFGNVKNSYTTSMEVFNEALYVGVYNEDGCGVWWSCDGNSWSEVVVSGLSSHNIAVRSMHTFTPAENNPYLYVGTENERGMQVWFTDNGIDWFILEENGFGDRNNTAGYAMAEFNHSLYIGTANCQSGTQIWRTKGGVIWEKVNTDGFGYSSNYATYSMCPFNGYLYAGTANHSRGTQVWRTADGVTWYQSNKDGFGDPRNACSYCMTVFNNRLYVGTGSTIGQVWCTEDGVSWEQVNGDGFGDSENRRVHSLAVYDNYLYAGTGNGKGAEIWRYYPQGEEEVCFLESVLEQDPEVLYTMRRIRDSVLIKSDEGLQYMRLYYTFSPELKEIYREHPFIRKKTDEVLKHLISMRLPMVGEKQIQTDDTSVVAITDLLEEYGRMGSAGLRLACELAKVTLREKGLLGLAGLGN